MCTKALHITVPLLIHVLVLFVTLLLESRFADIEPPSGKSLTTEFDGCGYCLGEEHNQSVH